MNSIDAAKIRNALTLPRTVIELTLSKEKVPDHLLRKALMEIDDLIRGLRT